MTIPPPDPYGHGPAGPPGPPVPAVPAPYPPPPYYPYPPARGTNTMAILALVFAFVFAPAAIVLGHIARRQIRETGEEGDGMALAGLIVGYIFTGISVLACLGYLVVVIVFIGAASTAGTV
ncbi:MAG: DUF4190 domain-containing protein [Micromonosporaceae bacterium]|nr:DUF4190 domain-containing protein [Micromonosporaceae bacterium]